MLVTTLLVGAGVGSTVVAVTGYAEAAGSRSWAGWLLAAQATGTLAGGLVLAARSPGDPYRRLVRATLALGLGYLPMLLVSPLPVMAVWVTVSGFALPAVLTSVFVAADRVAPPGTAAEAFAWVATAFLVGSAAGSAVDGALLDATGALRVGFAPAPLAILAAAGLLWLPGSSHRLDLRQRRSWKGGDEYIQKQRSILTTRAPRSTGRVMKAGARCVRPSGVTCGA